MTVTKSELMRMLENARDFEQMAEVLIHEKCLNCLKEIKNSELIINEDKHRMQRMLSELMSDAKDHGHTLEQLMQKIKGSGKNEF